MALPPPPPPGTVAPYGSTPPPAPSGTPTYGTPPPGNAGGAAPASTYPQSAMNLGGPVYPWLQAYQGQFTAPMSPWQTNALGGYGNFVQGGAGTGPAGQYYNNVLNGQYLNFNSNPWLQQIQNSGQSIKDYQDQQALQRIQSSMAAGGNALSGANAAAQGNYLNQSGANFENVMGNLFNQDYGMERGLQNAAAQGSLGAAGQYGNSLMNLMSMGSVPQQIQQQDLNAQYQDFLRQTQGYQNAFNYPGQMALAEQQAGKYPGYNQPNYGTSQAAGIAALLSSLFGGGGGAGGGALGGIGNLLSNLFGGGGGGNGPTPDPNAGTAGNTPGWGFTNDPNSQYYDPNTANWGTAGQTPGWGFDPSQSGGYYNPNDPLAQYGLDAEPAYDGEPDRSRQDPSSGSSGGGMNPMQELMRMLFGGGVPRPGGGSTYSQVNRQFEGNPADPLSNTPYGGDFAKQLQAWEYSLTNPGIAGADTPGVGPFGGAYGTGGFTRGTNENPNANPLVGDNRFYGSDPGGSMQQFSGNSMFGSGGLENAPGLSDEMKSMLLGPGGGGGGGGGMPQMWY